MGKLMQRDNLTDMMEPEQAARSAMASAAIGPISKRIDGAIPTLVDHKKGIYRLTNLFRREEPRLYSRLLLLQQFKESLRESDNNGGFHFPDMKEELVQPDLELRMAVKDGTRKHMVDMTKIFERSDGGGGRFSRRSR